MAKRSIPDVNITITDGGLGLIQPSSDNIFAFLGVATTGTPNQVYSGNSLEWIKATFTSGPLAEALAAHIALSGATTVAIPLNASTAGTVSAVTTVGATPLAGTGSVTAAGTPTDLFDITATIFRAGALGTATFTYTVDGGDNISPVIAVPSGGTFVIPATGITLTFTAGVSGISFQVGDTYKLTTTAPAATLSDLNDGIDALAADGSPFSLLAVVGQSTPTIAAGVDIRMSDFASKFWYARAILGIRDVSSSDTGSTPAAKLASWRTNIRSEWANFASLRVSGVAAYTEDPSPLTGRVNRVSGLGKYMGRLGDTAVHKHPGEVIKGPIAGIVSIYHDEDKNEGLDQAGFVTMRTFRGRKGFYITTGKTFAPNGSDYQYIENCRVMDKACYFARQALLNFLNTDVRVNLETGGIDDRDAKVIEAYVTGILFEQLINSGNASGVTVQINRTTNILSSRTMYCKIRIVPKAYLQYIETDIGFENPFFKFQQAQ